MNRLKRSITLILIVTAGILLTTSFVQTENEQILTLEIKESGAKDAVGIYVYQNGKNIDFVELDVYNPKKEDIIRNGEILNSVLNKYCKEGWQLISTTSPSQTEAFTRVIFKK